MGRLIIGVLIGLLLGAALTFYFFVGVPRAATPGTPVRPPDAGATSPPGTTQIVIRQDFFNNVLNTIFTSMSPPEFALSSGGTHECPGTLVLLPEGSAVRTGIQFGNNRLESPMAFRGSYNSMFGCMQFTGWANSVLELRYDQSTGSVFGVLNVETVNLDGVNPVVNVVLTPIVQSTLNSRVNPIQIVDGRQLAVDAPIASAKSNLKATVKDVRAEVKDGALNLYLEYEFGSGPLTQPSDAPPQGL